MPANNPLHTNKSSSLKTLLKEDISVPDILVTAENKNLSLSHKSLSHLRPAIEELGNMSSVAEAGKGKAKKGKKIPQDESLLTIPDVKKKDKKKKKSKDSESSPTNEESAKETTEIPITDKDDSPTPGKKPKKTKEKSTTESSGNDLKGKSKSKQPLSKSKLSESKKSLSSSKNKLTSDGKNISPERSKSNLSSSKGNLISGSTKSLIPISTSRRTLLSSNPELIKKVSSTQQLSSDKKDKKKNADSESPTTESDITTEQALTTDLNTSTEADMGAKTKKKSKKSKKNVNEAATKSDGVGVITSVEEAPLDKNKSKSKMSKWNLAAEEEIATKSEAGDNPLAKESKSKISKNNLNEEAAVPKSEVEISSVGDDPSLEKKYESEKSKKVLNEECPSPKSDAINSVEDAPPSGKKKSKSKKSKKNLDEVAKSDVEALVEADSSDKPKSESKKSRKDLTRKEEEAPKKEQLETGGEAIKSNDSSAPSKESKNKSEASLNAKEEALPENFMLEPSRMADIDAEEFEKLKEVTETVANELEEESKPQEAIIENMIENGLDGLENAINNLANSRKNLTSGFEEEQLILPPIEPQEIGPVQNLGSEELKIQEAEKIDPDEKKTQDFEYIPVEQGASLFSLNATKKTRSYTATNNGNGTPSTENIREKYLKNMKNPDTANNEVIYIQEITSTHPTSLDVINNVDVMNSMDDYVNKDHSNITQVQNWFTSNPEELQVYVNETHAMPMENINSTVEAEPGLQSVQISQKGPSPSQVTEEQILVVEAPQKFTIEQKFTGILKSSTNEKDPADSYLKNSGETYKSYFEGMQSPRGSTPDPVKDPVNASKCIQRAWRIMEKALVSFKENPASSGSNGTTSSSMEGMYDILTASGKSVSFAHPESKVQHYVVDTETERTSSSISHSEDENVVILLSDSELSAAAASISSISSNDANAHDSKETKTGRHRSDELSVDAGSISSISSSDSNTRIRYNHPHDSKGTKTELQASKKKADSFIPVTVVEKSGENPNGRMQVVYLRSEKESKKSHDSHTVKSKKATKAYDQISKSDSGTQATYRDSNPKNHHHTNKPRKSHEPISRSDSEAQGFSELETLVYDKKLGILFSPNPDKQKHSSSKNGYRDNSSNTATSEESSLDEMILSKLAKKTNGTRKRNKSTDPSSKYQREKGVLLSGKMMYDPTTSANSYSNYLNKKRASEGASISETDVSSSGARAEKLYLMKQVSKPRRYGDLDRPHYSRAKEEKQLERSLNASMNTLKKKIAHDLYERQQKYVQKSYKYGNKKEKSRHQKHYYPTDTEIQQDEDERYFSSFNVIPPIPQLQDASQIQYQYQQETPAQYQYAEQYPQQYQQQIISQEYPQENGINVNASFDYSQNDPSTVFNQPNYQPQFFSNVQSEQYIPQPEFQQVQQNNPNNGYIYSQI